MRYCVMCGSTNNIERHHIFGGGLRQKSEKYGLVIDLCHRCHNQPPNGVHFNKETMLKVHQYGQRLAMQRYGWTVEDFRREFYKNYL